MEKSVPEECSFCHRYHQKICREVSFYFFARFCTNQAACQQLHDLFSKLSRLLTWQALKLLCLPIHHLMGSQLFLWLLLRITEWLAAGLPKLPSVAVWLCSLLFSSSNAFSTNYLGPHLLGVWGVVTESGWLPIQLAPWWVSVRNPAG